MARLNTIIILVGVVLMVYGGFLFAQTQQPPPSRGAPEERDPRMEQAIEGMFRQMDTNHDNRISKSEWMAFNEKQFDRIDRNHKGYITRDDVRADMMARMRAQRQQERARPPE